jgi:hypothetical protein
MNFINTIIERIQRCAVCSNGHREAVHAGIKENSFLFWVRWWSIETSSANTIVPIRYTISPEKIITIHWKTISNQEYITMVDDLGNITFIEGENNFPIYTYK